MKNLFSFLVIGFIFISCGPNETSNKSTAVWPGSPCEEELYDIEVTFTQDSVYKPLSKNLNCKDSFDGEACLAEAQALKDQVIEEIKSIDKSIQIDEMFVRVYLDVSVYLEDLTQIQYDNIVENASGHNYTISIPFDVQARRPIMQTDYIQQARRPIMQEQLRYNETLKTSKMILEVGGGGDNLPPKPNRVWIVDSGIDSGHQDLKFEPAEVSLSEDFSKGNGDPFEDSLGHGTFLAGVIGGLASTNVIYAQGYGVKGVYPGAKMVSIKIFKDNGKAISSKILDALEHIWRYSNAGDIVNLSWGLNMSPRVCNDKKYEKIYAWIDSLATKGVYIVMSAGNDAEESLTNFPGCMDLATSPSTVKDKIFTIGSIEVPNPGSISRDYFYSSFSNFGRPSIDYLTPGEDVFTTAPGGQYVLVSGTSISAAMFSGILYHNPIVGTIKPIKRGAAQGDPDPDYPVAKVGN